MHEPIYFQMGILSNSSDPSTIFSSWSILRHLEWVLAQGCVCQSYYVWEKLPENSQKQTLPLELLLAIYLSKLVWTPTQNSSTWIHYKVLESHIIFCRLICENIGFNALINSTDMILIAEATITLCWKKTTRAHGQSHTKANFSRSRKTFWHLKLE